MKTFLEIGTADFDTLLPLARKGGWMGWCVEPVPHHAKTLRQEAKSLPVGIIEAAVTDRTGSIKMAVGGGSEQWTRGISHIIDDNHTGTRLLDFTANQSIRQQDITVKCFTLDDLHNMLSITSLDFCKIAVEGHEETILKAYSWRVKPKMLKVEHKHVPTTHITSILQAQGYHIFTETDDLYAIL